MLIKAIRGGATLEQVVHQHAQPQA
jgi:hypothetical protein